MLDDQRLAQPAEWPIDRTAHHDRGLPQLPLRKPSVNSLKDILPRGESLALSSSSAETSSKCRSCDGAPSCLSQEKCGSYDAPRSAARPGRRTLAPGPVMKNAATCTGRNILREWGRAPGPQPRNGVSATLLSSSLLRRRSPSRRPAAPPGPPWRDRPAPRSASGRAAAA